MQPWWKKASRRGGKTGWIVKIPNSHAVYTPSPYGQYGKQYTEVFVYNLKEIYFVV